MALQIHEPGQTPSPHATKPRIAIGIDLGTTHTVVALKQKDGIKVLQLDEGSSLLPSAVLYEKGQDPVVGQAALDAPQNQGLVTSSKRLMGKSAKDTDPLLQHFRMVDNPSTDLVHFEAGGEILNPVLVARDILAYVKQAASRVLGQPVMEAVITVPAYFDDAARSATRLAARLAGVDVLRIVNEPTAAALAYGLNQNKDGLVVVYDLGGGTFDLSVLKLEQGIFQVLATGGSTQLGGDDCDQLIMDHMQKTLALSPEQSRTHRLLARHIKEHLSTHEVFEGTVADKHYKITRNDFEELAHTLVQKTITLTREVLLDADLTVKDIDAVALVGGATRIPVIRRAVESFFDKPAAHDINPDEVVAIGAAAHAAQLQDGGGHLLLDVVPLSLGLETMGGLTEKLILRNTPIPCRITQEYTTYQANQTGLKIHVVQGERELVADNRSLAHFSLQGLPTRPAGTVRVEITFAVDADGILSVTAEEKSTGVMQHIEVKPTYGLPKTTIDEMIEDSYKNARTDMEQHLFVKAKTDLERLLISLKDALAQDRDVLDPNALLDLQHRIEEAEKALENQDRTTLQEIKNNLATTTQTFAKRRLEKALKGAAATRL